MNQEFICDILFTVEQFIRSDNETAPMQSFPSYSIYL